MALDHYLDGHRLVLIVDGDGLLNVGPQLIEGLPLGVDGFFYTASPPALWSPSRDHGDLVHSVYIISHGQ
jgi:hypothetical protein